MNDPAALDNKNRFKKVRLFRIARDLNLSVYAIVDFVNDLGRKESITGSGINAAIMDEAVYDRLLDHFESNRLQANRVNTRTAKIGIDTDLRPSPLAKIENESSIQNEVVESDDFKRRSEETGSSSGIEISNLDTFIADKHKEICDLISQQYSVTHGPMGSMIKAAEEKMGIGQLLLLRRWVTIRNRITKDRWSVPFEYYYIDVDEKHIEQLTREVELSFQQ